MKTNSTQQNQSAFTSAEEGKKYPLFDITGKQRREDHLRTLLNDFHKELKESTTQRIRSVLGSTAPKVNITPWGFEKPDDLEFWLSSTTGVHHTPAHPVLAMSKKALSSFSELFFDGNPNNVSEDQIAKAKITGTDDRQIGRIYQGLIQFLGENLGFDHSSWLRKWLEHEPEIELVWANVTVYADDWSFDFSFGWPVAMSYVEDVRGSGPIDGAELASELTRVPVVLSLELGQLNMSLPEINNFREGDILPFELYETVTAKAGNSECLEGHICDHDGQLCLRISKNLGME